MNPGLPLLMVIAVAGTAVVILARAAGRRRANLASLAPLWPPSVAGTPFVPQGGSLCACLLLAAIALAPRAAVEAPAARHEGGTVIAVDISRSMLARDVEPDRLVVSLKVLADGVAAHPGRPYGVVAFASQAMVACPLTLDTDAVLAALAALIQRPVVGSTSIARGLDAALQMFAGTNGSRAVVLVTDGEDLDGEIDKVLAKFVQGGIAVSTLGIGTVGGGVVPPARPGAAPDARGPSRLNASLLKGIARRTGGAFLHIDRTETSPDVVQVLAAGAGASSRRITRSGVALAALASAGLLLVFELLPGASARLRGRP